MLREFVQDRLKKKWSPEQICQGLRREFPQESRLPVIDQSRKIITGRGAGGGVNAGGRGSGRRSRAGRERTAWYDVIDGW